MHRLVYADLTNQRLLRDLGGAQVTFAKLPSRSVMRLALRFSEQIGGTHVGRYPTINALRATIGPVDQRPEFGTLSLKVGAATTELGTNLTTALVYPFTAVQLATALNVLSVVGDAVVEDDDDTYVITGIAAPITVVTNTLRPITFGRIESYEVNGATTQALRLQRAPYAWTNTWDQRVPAGPSITRVQAGGSADGVEWNEIQKLTTPREFSGSYLLKAANEVARTGLLGVGDGPDQVAEALNPAANYLGLAPDAAGRHIVTEHPTEPAMFIEFAGSMAGEAQALLKTTVFDAPAGDFYIALDLNTPATSEAFRDTDEVVAMLEIFADMDDEEGDPQENVPIFRGSVVIAESVIYDDLGTPQNPDWTNPPQARTYTPVSPDALASGSRYVDFLLGNGADVAHQVTHSLNSPRVRIHLRGNTAGGRDLVPGTDYEIAHDTNNAATITFLGTYASSPPASNAISGTAQDLRLTSSFDTHTHTIAEVIGLQTILDAYAASIAALQAGNFGGSAPAVSTTTGTIARALPRVWKIPRARVLPADPGSLLEWNPFAEGSTLRDIRLLPAVHLAAASVESMPTLLPAPAAAFRGRVFYSPIDRDDIVGGIRAGQYIACDGRDWYRVAREDDAESTWYPTIFGPELFRLSISPDELALRTRLELAVGLELALIDPSRRPDDRRTVGRMSLLLERGIRVAAATPGTPGSNIDEHFGSPVVLARHDFDLTAVPAQKRLSLTIARDGAGVLTALAGKFLAAPVVVSPPATADFALRLRLARVDFEDLPADARGVLAIRGLDVGLDGKQEIALGRWTIS